MNTILGTSPAARKESLIDIQCNNSSVPDAFNRSFLQLSGDTSVTDYDMPHDAHRTYFSPPLIKCFTLSFSLSPTTPGEITYI